MYIKTIGLFIFSTSSISLLTWGGIKANNSSEYNSRMWEYEKWRKEFYNEELYDKTHMCSSSDINECSSQQYKQYLPKPNEDKLWKELYKELEENNKNIREKNLEANSGSRSKIKEELEHIKSYEDLKDHCYLEVKEAIIRDKGRNKSIEEAYFNVDTNTGKEETKEKHHDRCVLRGNQLKQ